MILILLNLSYKPKARNNKLQTPELNSLNLTVSSAPSYVLLNWADVCLTAPTSIYLEAIIQNKVFIYPKFLFEKTMIFEEANVGWIVNGYDELKNALLKLRAESSYKPYSDENIHKFFTETVHGGIENRDVLTDYTHFILRKIRFMKIYLDSGRINQISNFYEAMITSAPSEWREQIGEYWKQG